eukprot:scaffold23118_cov17-Prasinocladus_malaysianus.AAC.1
MQGEDSGTSGGWTRTTGCTGRRYLTMSRGERNRPSKLPKINPHLKHTDRGWQEIKHTVLCGS